MLLPLLCCVFCAGQGLEFVVVVYVVFCRIFFGGEADAGCILCEVHQSAPHQGGDINALAGIVHVEEHFAGAVVQFDIETSSDGEEHHFAGAVCVVAAQAVVLHLVGPEDASDGEWHMSFCLGKGETSACVGNVWQLYDGASFGEPD